MILKFYAGHLPNRFLGLCLLSAYFLTILSAAPLLAQTSQAALDITYDGAQLLAAVSLDTTAEECSVDLYAASDPTVLVTLPGTAQLVASTALIDRKAQISARNLLPLRIRSARAVKEVTFRARITCGDRINDSGIVPLVVTTSRKRGVASLKLWLKQLKRQVPINAFTLVDATPGFNFDRPVDIQYPRDGTKRLFIVEQSGKIFLVRPGKTVKKTLFLDVSDKIKLGGNLGLLSLAFHPKFSKNGLLYLHFSNAGDGDTVIAQYSLKLGKTDEADATSEKRILQVDQQETADHVGGQIAFGDDGFLYIALGDGGSGAFPVVNNQILTNLFGKILRIDVDSPSDGRNYGIPNDNPFGNEVWAFGLRNPFKISFDRSTGRLWAGDVGQDAVEEVDLIEGGKNYGWNIAEGSLCYKPQTGCDFAGLEAPIAEYSHHVGLSLTGGYVYRGSSIKQLQGFYLYGDFINGKLFGLNFGEGPTVVTQLAKTEQFISTFGLDWDNELYVAGYTTGKIFRFTKR